MTAISYTYRGEARSRLLPDPLVVLFVRAISAAGAEHVQIEEDPS